MASSLSTVGFVQPIVWPPYGWMPYVSPTMIAMRPRAKVMFPGQSMRRRPGARGVSRNL